MKRAAQYLIGITAVILLYGFAINPIGDVAAKTYNSMYMFFARAGVTDTTDISFAGSYYPDALLGVGRATYDTLYTATTTIDTYVIADAGDIIKFQQWQYKNYALGVLIYVDTSGASLKVGWRSENGGMQYSSPILPGYSYTIGNDHALVDTLFLQGVGANSTGTIFYAKPKKLR